MVGESPHRSSNLLLSATFNKNSALGAVFISAIVEPIKAEVLRFEMAALRKSDPDNSLVTSAERFIDSLTLSALSAKLRVDAHFTQKAERKAR